MRFGAALVLGAFLAITTASLAFGQGFQGGLRGSIKDSGGVIPGVEVTLTNERTNISRSTTTNERGEYVFTTIDPGSYFLQATLPGYKTIARREIPIGTQQFLTMDLSMEVGAIEENITVTGQSPIIETSNASQGTVLDTQALQTLPSPGRAAFLIGASVPTVTRSGRTIKTASDPVVRSSRSQWLDTFDPPTTTSQRSPWRSRIETGQRFAWPMKPATKTLTGWS